MKGLQGLHNKISRQRSVLRMRHYREYKMLFTIIVAIFLLISFMIFLTLIMPVVLKTHGERTRRQVSEMTSGLRMQLDRVEAQQCSLIKDIVMMKSYAVNPVSASNRRPCSDGSQEHALSGTGKTRRRAFLSGS